MNKVKEYTKTKELAEKELAEIDREINRLKSRRPKLISLIESIGRLDVDDNSKNEMKVRDMVENILIENNEAMTVHEIMNEMKRIGFQMKGTNHEEVIRQALIKNTNIRKIKEKGSRVRYQYILKTTKHME